MSNAFQSHKPKTARLGKAGLRAGAPLEDATLPAKRPNASGAKSKTPETSSKAKEIGGPSGPEPTRYGDWERKGICYDF